MAEALAQGADLYYGRTPEERAYDAELMAQQFLSEKEMRTLTVLCDIILPPGDTYKGASDADVVGLIEFMAKDIPELQLPLRGGLMYLDHRANTAYGSNFADAPWEQQKQIIDPIAYYDPEVPEAERGIGVNFFSLIRNLTLTGFYTSKIGIEELGYKGNQPNQWDGVPQDVLDQHGVAYDPEWLAKCVDHSTKNTVAEWDADGNLIS